jgi:hypothetical protein
MFLFVVCVQLRHKADSRVNRRRYLLVDFEGERVVTRRSARAPRLSSCVITCVCVCVAG